MFTSRFLVIGVVILIAALSVFCGLRSGLPGTPTRVLARSLPPGLWPVKVCGLSLGTQFTLKGDKKESAKSEGEPLSSGEVVKGSIVRKDDKGKALLVCESDYSSSNCKDMMFSLDKSRFLRRTVLLGGKGETSNYLGGRLVGVPIKIEDISWEDIQVGDWIEVMIDGDLTRVVVIRRITEVGG